MVDEKKLRIMTKIAFYENSDSMDEIKASGMYKSDYIRSHLFSVIWSFTIAYFVLLLLLAMYYLDFLVSSINLLGYQELAISVVAVYILLMLGCGMLGTVYYAEKYERSKRLRKEYYGELRKLKQYYEQVREGGNE